MSFVNGHSSFRIRDSTSMLADECAANRAFSASVEVAPAERQLVSFQLLSH